MLQGHYWARRLANEDEPLGGWETVYVADDLVDEVGTDRVSLPSEFEFGPSIKPPEECQ